MQSNDLTSMYHPYYDGCMSRKAIVAYDGRQLSCAEGDVIVVNRLPNEVGETVTIKPVIAYLDGTSMATDAKKLKSAAVEATVEAHERLAKVVTRKYRRRKSSRSQYAHRQPVTRLKITAITVAV